MGEGLRPSQTLPLVGRRYPSPQPLPDLFSYGEGVPLAPMKPSESAPASPRIPVRFTYFTAYIYDVFKVESDVYTLTSRPT